MGTQIGAIRVGAIRVVEPGKQAYPGQLRPSTLIPRQEPGSLQAFQHGHQRDIQAFLVSKGWFFKHDRGTNRVVSNISNTILEKLEQQVFDEELTEEQQRKFGCVLMTVADIQSKLNTSRSINTDLENYLNNAASISQLIGGFQDQLTDTEKLTYQYWQGFIRSLAEGQGKVDEMYRRKFVGGDSLTRRDPTPKYMSTKHDLAIALGINSGNDYNSGAFNQAIGQLEDCGHIRRKVESWSEDQKKIYLVSGALHTLYLQKHGGVPTIPSDPDEFVAFKSKAIEDLQLLKTSLNVSFHDFVDKVIEKISRDTSNEVVTNFIQFGSLGNKEHTRQVLKRQIKDSCVLPLNEAITAPKNDSELYSVYKIQDVFNGPVTIDSQGPIYTYLFGLKKEVDVDNFTTFVVRVKEQLKNRVAIKSKDYLELFKGREEEGLWMLSRFMEKGQVNDEDAKAIIEQWIDETSVDKSKADRRKAIVILKAQNRFDYDRLHRLLGNQTEVERVLTEVPIRVGAGAAHYVVEYASIQCLSKYLDNPNNKLKRLAARALWNLSRDLRDFENRKAIREARCIPKLIQCLDSDNTELKRDAAAALCSLSGITALCNPLGRLSVNSVDSVDAENRKAIREAGGIPKLIQCLDSDNTKLKRNAARALYELSVDAENDEVVGIPKLIQCLDSDNTELKRDAARTLCNLARNAENRKAIGEAEEGIPKLIHCLASNDAELQKSASDVLCTLATHSDMRQRIQELLNGSEYELEEDCFFGITINKNDSDRNSVFDNLLKCFQLDIQ